MNAPLEILDIENAVKPERRRKTWDITLGLEPHKEDNQTIIGALSYLLINPEDRDEDDDERSIRLVFDAKRRTDLHMKLATGVPRPDHTTEDIALRNHQIEALDKIEPIIVEKWAATLDTIKVAFPTGTRTFPSDIRWDDFCQSLSNMWCGHGAGLEMPVGGGKTLVAFYLASTRKALFSHAVYYHLEGEAYDPFRQQPYTWDELLNHKKWYIRAMAKQLDFPVLYMTKRGPLAETYRKFDSQVGDALAEAVAVPSSKEDILISTMIGSHKAEFIFASYSSIEAMYEYIQKYNLRFSAVIMDEVQTVSNTSFAGKCMLAVAQHAMFRYGTSGTFSRNRPDNSLFSVLCAIHGRMAVHVSTKCPDDQKPPEFATYSNIYHVLCDLIAEADADGITYDRWHSDPRLTYAPAAWKWHENKTVKQKLPFWGVFQSPQWGFEEKFVENLIFDWKRGFNRVYDTHALRQLHEDMTRHGIVFIEIPEQKRFHYVSFPFWTDESYGHDTLQTDVYWAFYRGLLKIDHGRELDKHEEAPRQALAFSTLMCVEELRRYILQRLEDVDKKKIKMGDDYQENELDALLQNATSMFEGLDQKPIRERSAGFHYVCEMLKNGAKDEQDRDDDMPAFSPFKDGLMFIAPNTSKAVAGRAIREMVKEQGWLLDVVVCRTSEEAEKKITSKWNLPVSLDPVLPDGHRRPIFAILGLSSGEGKDMACDQVIIMEPFSYNPTAVVQAAGRASRGQKDADGNLVAVDVYVLSPERTLCSAYVRRMRASKSMANALAQRGTDESAVFAMDSEDIANLDKGFDTEGYSTLKWLDPVV